MGYDDRYDPDADFDRWYTIGTGRAIGGWIRAGDTVLELGCATGLMSELLVAAGATVVGIDRSADYLARARARELPGSRFVEGDVTTVELGRQFDHVVVANLLHELPEPASAFGVIAQHLCPGGLVHLTVPNPSSLHRRVGREMGVLPASGISDRAAALETLHVLDGDDLERLGGEIGLTVVNRTGVMLKPLPNDRMVDLPDDLLEGFLALGPSLPDLCAMTYLVLR